MTQTICIKDQTFLLHPFGVMYWKEKAMLLIADVHLGKISHFRKHGSAIPAAAIFKNFEQLDEVIAFFQPQKVCFLGDLFHSYKNTEWQFFEAWIAKQESDILLLIGNHDIIDERKYQDLGIKTGTELTIDSILLTHHPEERAGFFNFCGHIHPGVQLQGLGKQRLKLPCFFQKPNQLILPAFGVFTGIYVLEPEEEDKVYAITSKEVIIVS
ncbi:ligase-associated DNA damage response endonuclease PdeM [Aquimarina brevivitae]|uniref:Putative phosphoesterase n=1 Tax=Aquimarina brevivitae TaxID=323412 RepID=A0A4Q7PF33_9FLAO|nr:ligase-associated DNA damage response endonuclease PdeM [Aquimarina brevivitae]RZS99054.1 putative phosphoesterase [Aquimarina brevivitae]